MELLLLIAAIPLALAAIPATVASSKGRDPVGWFLYGLAVFPVAFFHALLMAPDQASLDRRRLASGEARTCPACAEVVLAAARVCRFCGRDLPEAPPRAGPRTGPFEAPVDPVNRRTVLILGAAAVGALLLAAAAGVGWRAMGPGRAAQAATAAPVLVWASADEQQLVMVGCARAANAASDAVYWAKGSVLTEPFTTWTISAAKPRTGACRIRTAAGDPGVAAIALVCADATRAECTPPLWVEVGARRWEP